MDAREGTSATDLVKTIYLEIIMEQLDIFDNIDLADVSTKEDDPVVQNTVILYTPNGSAVSATDMRNITDWTRSEKDALNAYYSTAYPGANRLSDPTKKYNCHSYAWYWASTGNYYWISNPNAYMNDGSYSKVSAIKVGDKTYWTNGSHSGIVAGVGSGGTSNIRFVSKWGSLGLYNHFLWDCPYSGSISNWRR